MTFFEKDGRFVGETRNGDIVPFDSEAEMIACAKLRHRIDGLLGHKKQLEDYLPGMKLKPEIRESKEKRVVRVRIHSGVYEVNGIRLKKKKALA